LRASLPKSQLRRQASRLAGHLGSRGMGRSTAGTGSRMPDPPESRICQGTETAIPVSRNGPATAIATATPLLLAVPVRRPAHPWPS
jgi:hypothetical protein